MSDDAPRECASPRSGDDVTTLVDSLTYTADGLVAAIIRDDATGEVLMLGWMNPEALRRTLTTGRVWFWSRSRQEYWRKGDTSGHIQQPVRVAIDCDRDALLIDVIQTGAACHTGARSCFGTGGTVTLPPATNTKGCR